MAGRGASFPEGVIGDSIPRHGQCYSSGIYTEGKIRMDPR